MLTCSVFSLPVSIVLLIDIGIFPDLWLWITSFKLAYNNVLKCLPSIATYSSSLPSPSLLLSSLVLNNLFYYYNLIFWCTIITIINTFWNKYGFVSPSSKNLTKMNLKHLHKGYYTACQCWSIVPATANMHPIIGLCHLCMTLRFFGPWVIVFIKVY